MLPQQRKKHVITALDNLYGTFWCYICHAEHPPLFIAIGAQKLLPPQIDAKVIDAEAFGF
jgi:hypothetical protein